MTILTTAQRLLQSTETLGPIPVTGPTAQIFSVGNGTTQLQTVTSSVISTSNSVSVTDGTTADSGATYVGLNGGTPMFAIKNPNGSTPPNLNNPLAAPAIPATTPQGFDTKGKTSQGLLGNL